MHQIKWVSPDVLKPNPRNARTHSKKQVRQIADSIVAFGFVVPLVAEEYTWFEPVLLAAIIVFIIDVIGSTIVFSSRPVLNALASAIVFAIIFGFLVYYGYGKVEMSVSTTPQPSAPAQSPPAPAPTSR
jgi:hypothetical protein